jgi:metal transporter CNNM
MHLHMHIQIQCSRYALRIGSATIPIVLVIRFLVWPIAAPLAFVLDKALGRELASTYSNAEMLKLLQIHVQENVMDAETAGAMKGALTYKNTSVKEVMTPIERTFMLNVDEKLNFETVARIFRTGYSRIPVFEISQNNVIGLLFVKDLIFVDPEDGTPVRSFVQIFGRGVHVVWPDDKLGDVLAELKQGRSHLALVRDVNNEDDTQDPFYEVKGIITLEDIIEKIIGDKIVDETDAFVDNSQRIKVDRGESFEWARLRLLDAKIVDEMLSYSEARAVCAHLRMNHTDAVKWLTDTQLERLVSETSVSNLPTATRELGKGLPNELMYEKGVNSHVCTLILGGKITILVGNDNFRSDISSWALLATKALMDPLYVPDFTAYVSDGPSRCLCFTHEAFAAAVDASAVERRSEASSPHVGSPTLSEPSLSDASIDPTAVAGNTADHPSRRDKLIAALHPFRKDVSLSHGTESVKPKEEAAPTPRQSVVRFEGGGIMHTPSTRSMPKLNLQSDVDELSDSMRTEPSSSVATESEAAVGVPPTIHEEPDHSDSALPEVAQDAGDPKENRPSSPPPPEEK